MKLGILGSVLLIGCTIGLFAGQPIWPPKPFTHEARRANMVYLRFQDALADHRWDDAIALCSEHVKTNALKWPSIESFFTETVPLTNFLATHSQLITLARNPAK